MADEADYEFLFIVDGVSIDDDEAVAVLTEDFDAVLSWNRGCCRLAVSGEGAGPRDALGKLLSRISAALPGLRIVRLDPELVGVSDIAQRTGHSRQNIQQWVNGERNAGRPFPPPEGCAGRSLVWRWPDVNDWLRSFGLGDDAVRPSRAEAARIDVMLLDWNNAHAGQEPAPAVALLAGWLVSICATGRVACLTRMLRNALARLADELGKPAEELRFVVVIDVLDVP